MHARVILSAKFMSCFSASVTTGRKVKKINQIKFISLYFSFIYKILSKNHTEIQQLKTYRITAAQ